MKHFSMVIGPKVERCLHYRKDLLELWLVQNLEFQMEAYFKKLETLPFPCQYAFSIMNSIINNE